MLVSGRNGKACVVAPAIAGAHRDQETLDIGRDLRGHPAGQHRLEMPPGKRVLLLEEEGAGEFKTHTDQTGVHNQHLPEGRDRLVQQIVPLVFVLGNRRGLDRRHAPLEQGAEVRRRLFIVRGRERGGGKRDQKNENGTDTTHEDSIRPEKKRKPRRQLRANAGGKQ